MLEKSPRRSDKRNGEWAEAQFVADAMRQGFDVFRPIGDSASIDFIISKRNIIQTIKNNKKMENEKYQPSRKINICNSPRGMTSS